MGSDAAQPATTMGLHTTRHGMVEPEHDAPNDIRRLDTQAPDDSHGADSIDMFSIFNVQGLKPRTVPGKVPYIQDLLQTSKQLFIALTETWLRDHTDAELDIEGYTLFRQDRQRPRKRGGRDSGGVAFYLRNDIASDVETILQYSNGVIEILGLYVKAKDLILVNLYRQPDDLAGGHRSTSVEFKVHILHLPHTNTGYTSMW